MKKYLITAALAVAISGAFVSCNKDDVFSDSLIEQKAKAFDETFFAGYGIPAPNHTWGFESNTITRGEIITRGDSDCGQCYKYDMQYDTPSFPKTGHPAPISDSERAYVKNWFETNPGLSEVGLDIHDFYIQHVWGQANKNYNVRNEDTGVVEVNQGTMDYCEVGDGTNYTHVLDFNANGPGSYGIVYMRNSSALSFGFHATWGDNRDYHNFKLAHIVGTAEDGTKIDGWYVGLAMYGSKWDNGTKVLNYDQLNYADDWILKIVPGESTPPGDDWEIIEGYKVEEVGRVFCEDLGVSSLNDIDYNDIVFDAAILHRWCKLVTKKNGQVINETYSFSLNGYIGYNTHSAEVWLLAAGGTIPATVGGQEVHNQFSGKSTKIMINTAKDNSKLRGAEIAEHDPVQLDYIDGINSINEIDIYALFNNQVIKIDNSEGHAPYKLKVPLGTRWTKEREKIGEAYPKFTEYCSDPTVKFWEGNNINGDLLWDKCDSPVPSKYLEIGKPHEDVVASGTGNNGSNEGNNNEGNNNEGNNNGGNNDSGNNGETKPGQIWPVNGGAGSATNVSMDVNTAKSKFDNATPGQKLCIYSDSTNGWIMFAFGGWPSLNSIEGFSAPTGWYIDGQVIRPYDRAFQNGRFVIELSQVSINTIITQGFMIQGSYNITNITIE